MNRTEARETLVYAIGEFVDNCIDAGDADKYWEAMAYYDSLPEVAPSNGDLISRADAIEAVHNYFIEEIEKTPHAIDEDGDDVYTDMTTVNSLLVCNKNLSKTLKSLPSAEAVQGWIPVKWHEITDEEREREGYPKDWVVYIDCDMPCDEQEILVQTKNGYIRWDVCYEDGEFSLDSGWDWVEDIVAWMPLPEPYEGSESDEVD